LSRADVAWYLTIEQTHVEGILFLVLAGRLSSLTSLDLARTLSGLRADRHRGIVLDLTRVDYVSSAGFRVLQEAADRQHKRGGGVVVTGLGEAVRLAFALAGPIPHLAVEDSRDRAVAHLKERSC
jgi:stage II sporulation protein AA (anti-sigma F factor antagonist)